MDARLIWAVAFASVVSFGCTGEETGSDAGLMDAAGTSDAGGLDPTEKLFSPHHLIDVQIEMADTDWNALRNEGRSLPHAISWCGDRSFEYTYFEAAVTIDGERHERVGVRKKGFLGSISTRRPSLKLHFARYPDVAERTYSGMKRMTLNNDRQDPSHTHQCMAYYLFGAAGIVSPRCNHARVTVNGVDLGIYSHIEPIKKPFLARHFADENGNLYEANARADFVVGLSEEYERKTNELDSLGQPASRQDLAAVVEALEVPDAMLYDSLDRAIEMDSFMTFWAMEVLTAHWDGHTGNRNNHYIYNDPTSGKFHFMPWGTDGAFSEHAFLPSLPSSVYAWSVIAHRLYNYQPTRDQFRQRVQELLDSTWDEGQLAAEASRIGALTGADPRQIEQQRNFINFRRTAIQSELDSAAPPWPYGLDTSDAVCNPPTEISGTFSTSWRNYQFDFVPSPASSVQLTLRGNSPTFDAVGMAAGPEGASIARVNFFASRASDPNLLVLLHMPIELLEVGTTTFHGFETFGIVLVDQSANDWVPIGFFGGGSIDFVRAGTNVGDPIEGSFTGFFAGP